jgi:hypothetical protein
MRRMRHLKPREIQGCQLALDASIATSLYDTTSGGGLVAANGAVARWEDQSGNGYHVTQATGANQPLRRVAQKGGLDTLQFDNTNDRMINASISVSLPTTVFAFGQTSEDLAVFVDSYNNVSHTLYRAAVSGDIGNLFGMSSGNTAASIARDSEWGGLVGTNSATNGKTIERGRLTGSTASNATSALSGVSVGALRGNPAPIVSTYYLNGYAAEVAVWNSILSPSVRRRLNDSRSRKWRTDR